mmetsp:Transcript_26429/g.47952  ORF Transcript_26429/g.47952 Transcript_26429/m.47952 type:complete len:143 (-) Transcript_26429:523-951(-)
MGGAVAYFNYNANPSMWSGVVFVCPMCKISDSMLPPKWVTDLFLSVLGESGTVNLFGLLPIAPTKGNLLDLAFKLMEKRLIATKSPFGFGRNPRLATARELVVRSFHRNEETEPSFLHCLRCETYMFFHLIQILLHITLFNR